MSKRIFFTPHLGLGDHFTCNGIVRELSKKCSILVMPVKEHNLTTVRRMFSDLDNVYLLPIVGSLDYGDVAHMEDAVSLVTLYEKRGYESKGVGVFGPDFDVSSKTYDEVFYDQVDIPFECRWESFHYPRDLRRELELFRKFEDGKLIEGKYIFLQDDPTRGRHINRDFINKGFPLVSPDKKFWDGDILDYAYLLENAKEIHCVNSAFADMMDGLDLSRVERLAVHEYARPGDPVQYKNNFEILK